MVRIMPRKGQTVTAEQRATISVAKRGKKHPPDCGHCIATSGPRQISTYYGAHRWARRILKDDPCAMDDATCEGRLEAAFRHDAPAELVRRNGRGLSFCVSLNIRDGYMRLCHSHHLRYDNGAVKGAA